MIEQMAPFFSYYGGKQRLASKIIPYIPRHTVYVEPFCGGATILFKKKTPEVSNNNIYREYINDTNDMVVDFFRCLQNKETREKLFEMLEYTPYSEQIHTECKNKNINMTWENMVDKAYCFYISILKSFANILNGSFGYNIKNENKAESFNNKKENLFKFVDRINHVGIFNRDALDVIKALDGPQTFFYIDPPYINTNQGHYNGYTKEDFINLIELLKNIKGSFILSCYLNDFVPKEWKRVDFEVMISASRKKDVDKKRTECIWIVDNGGGIEQDYFRKIYERPEFTEIWPLEDEFKEMMYEEEMEIII